MPDAGSFRCVPAGRQVVCFSCVLVRAVLLALCAAAPFPQPQPGLTLEAASRTLDVRPQEEVVPRSAGAVEEIVVTGHRAPMQADPHRQALPFRDVPQQLQAADLWAQHIGVPPCCQSPFETDIGGQAGRP